jgi:hypothetical protein
MGGGIQNISAANANNILNPIKENENPNVAADNKQEKDQSKLESPS